MTYTNPFKLLSAVFDGVKLRKEKKKSIGAPMTNLPWQERWWFWSS